jgi:hypothetical protein
MSCLATILLVAAGIGVASINGLEHTGTSGWDLVPDLVGGLLILAGLAAPRFFGSEPD